MNDKDRKNIAAILDGVAYNDVMTAAINMQQLLEDHPEIVDELECPEWFLDENGKFQEWQQQHSQFSQGD